MKKVKRILALTLMLVMLLSVLPLSAQAYAPLMDSYDRSADVSLGMYSEEALAAFPVEDFLNLIGVSGVSKIAWSRSNGYENNDDYTVTDVQSGTMDLRFADGRQSYSVYLVTGDRALHADRRWRVDVTNDFFKSCTLHYTAEESGELLPVPHANLDMYNYSRGNINALNYHFAIYPDAGKGKYVVKYTMDAENVKVYEGLYESVEAAKASGKEITPEDNRLNVTSGWNEKNDFCFVYTLNGEEVYRNAHFSIGFYVASIWPNTLKKDGQYIQNSCTSRYENNVQVCSITLHSSETSPDDEYALTMSFYPPSYSTGITVESAYVEGGTTDIKDDLFGETGYTASYGGDGQLFKVTDSDGNKYEVRVKIIGAEDGSDEGKEYYNGDTHFQAKTAALDDGKRVDSYLVMPPDADSLYSASENCYQTILLNPDTALDMSQLKPIFWVADGTQAFAKSAGEVAAVKQTSGVSVVDFAESPVQYTARDSRGTAIKNYWVTYVQKQTEPMLFVNGPSFDALQTGEVAEKDKREVILTGTDSYHDVFFANLGGSSLTGLSVSLDEEAQKTLKLDEFWTVAGSDSFDAFRDTSRYSANNISKLRLRLKDAPENLETSEINGVLTISSDAGTRYVYLTGTIAPEIITDDVPDGVKYVPYSVMIQTNNHSDSNTVTYSVESGNLPSGVSLNPATGEIYGVPTQTGTYEFTVKASFSNTAFEPVSKTYTIEILDNTDENVDASCDDKILNRVFTMGDVNDDWKGQYHDQVFRIDRAYDQFVKFFLDGEELVNGVDYDAEEGSTKITIREKTFRRAGRGKHTIAAEFRESDRVMKKDAQNYESYVEDLTPVNPTPSKPSKNPDKNNNTTAPSGVFDDVRKNDWFYDDVMWAYEQKYMVGVSSRLFAPNQNITQAMAVTVLARITNADLKSFEKAGETAQWYTTAARWADSIGLIELSKFAPAEPLARGELAIMLVKLFDEIEVEYTKPEADEKAVFSDAAQMTAEEEEVFQILHFAGIFRGNGKNDMQPDASTTRAQFSALIQRLTKYIDRHSGEKA